jgi:hypothetical protein
MKSKNVMLIAWTSEGAAGANKADEEWGLVKDCGYSQVIGDETNQLALYLQRDELLTDLIIATPEQAKVTDLVTPGTYPNGIAMASQVWWAHHGLVCFEWSSKFEEPTLGGPNRPDPAFVWEQVSKRKQALDHGNAVMPVHGDSIRTCAKTDLELIELKCDLL